MDQGRYRASMAIQAYNKPSRDARTDLIVQSAFRLDLDRNDGQLLRLSADPITGLPLGRPPPDLDYPWDARNERRMLYRMKVGPLGVDKEVNPSPPPPAPIELEPAPAPIEPAVDSREELTQLARDLMEDSDSRASLSISYDSNYGEHPPPAPEARNVPPLERDQIALGARPRINAESLADALADAQATPVAPRVDSGEQALGAVGGRRARCADRALGAEINSH